MTEINAEQELAKLSVRFTDLIQQNSALAADNERLTEELIRACAELSGIKKQSLEGYVGISHYGDKFLVGDDTSKETLERIKAYPVCRHPVHQHSFTLSGIGTFYADSELEITYLERLHGVGGKANLKAVDDSCGCSRCEEGFPCNWSEITGEDES